jgi:mono/diheme cytochrome c family protein
MSRCTWIAVLMLFGCGSPTTSAPSRPTTQTGPVQPVDLARGSYVAAVSGCATCHTPMKDGRFEAARMFAGGVEGKLADGSVWRSPNITPDVRTGIGGWSDDEIVTAVRQGVRPDGERLMPIMPYPYYHRMTDADARAVVAFLRAQRPIANPVRKSDRLPMQPVELATPRNNVDRTDDPKDHGEYLASLMHCAGCHTPQSGPLAGVAFAGGNAFVHDGHTMPAPNITSDLDTGIGQWSEADLARTLRTMRSPDGTPIEGPMAMYQNDWSRLTKDDALAVATYIKSIPPVKNAVEHAPTVSISP